MMEGNEYGTNIHLNHCTVLNTVEWVIQSGWLENLSITNSIFVNPYMFGYRAADVCSDEQDYHDFVTGECDPPSGALIDVTPVDSFGFKVDFTDQDRKIFVGYNSYIYQDWLLDWYKKCDWCKHRICYGEGELLHQPFPYIGKKALAFIDSMDGCCKIFTYMNVDSSTIYFVDPEFIEPATNLDTLKMFLEFKWRNSDDVDWSYRRNAGYLQTWPLPENLAYRNAELQTSAMNGLPLGDLNWYPDRMSAWKAQRDIEWWEINDRLNAGIIIDNVKTIAGTVPDNYTLEQNYPNPFNPTTNIEYAVPVSGYISLKIHNRLGQEVATLFEGNQQAGKYVATFDGSGLASGVYLYRLESGNVSLVKKLVLIK